MRSNIETFVHHGEILPAKVLKAANAVLNYLRDERNYKSEYSTEGDLAIFQIQDLYSDPVEFVRLIDALESLPEIDQETVEITHSLDRNALTVAPKGTHMKLDEVI